MKYSTFSLTELKTELKEWKAELKQSPKDMDVQIEVWKIQDAIKLFNA